MFDVMEFIRPHIYWGLIRFHAPSSASEVKDTSGSLVITIDDQKINSWSFKWKDSKEIKYAGKEVINCTNKISVDDVTWNLCF